MDFTNNNDKDYTFLYHKLTKESDKDYYLKLENDLLKLKDIEFGIIRRQFRDNSDFVNYEWRTNILKSYHGKENLIYKENSNMGILFKDNRNWITRCLFRLTKI
jgi:hypothetical protein